MKLKDMILTLRTIAYERVEIRDEYGNEIFTCNTSDLSGPPTSSTSLSSASFWETYKDYKVVEWFPHGAPYKDATFTVYIKKCSEVCHEN